MADGKIEISTDLNIDEAVKTIQKISDLIDKIKPFKVTVDADAAKSELASVASTAKSIDDSSDIEISATADTTQAESSIDSLDAKSKDLADDKPTIQADAETQSADAKIDGVSKKADEIDKKKPKVKADAETKDADTKIDGVSKKADEIDKKKPKVKAEADTGKTNEELDKVKKKSEDLDKEKPTIEPEVKSDKAKKEIDDLKTSLEGVGKVVSGVAAAAGVAIGAMVASIGKMGIDFNSEMEQYQAAFTTMLGSAEKATALTEQIRVMGAQTPFEMSDLMEASQVLLNFGSSQEEVMGQMKMLGDISQGNKEKFNGLTVVFGQVQSAGKMMGQDLMQMINNGFNPLQVISKKTGESMSDLKDKMSDGQISFEMVQEAMKDATSAGGMFYQAMDMQSKTMAGQWSTIMDNFSTKAGGIMKPLTDFITNVGLPTLNSFIEGINIEPIADKVGEAMDKLSDALATPEMQAALDSISEAITNTIVSVIELASNAIPMLISAFSFLAENGIIIVSVLGAIVAGITAFQAITTIVAIIKGITTAVQAAAAAQGIWNAVMAANPIGLLATVIGLAVGAIILFTGTVKNAKKESEQYAESLDNLNKKASENKSMSTAISRYKELKQEMKDGSLTAEELAAKQTELNNVRQWIVDNSDGIVNAELEQSDALDKQITTLEKMTEVERKAFEAQLQRELATAQSKLPELEREQNELLEQRDMLYQGLADSSSTAAELALKQSEMQLLVDQGLLETAEGQEKYNQLLMEASQLTEGAYNMQHIEGVAAAVEDFDNKAAKTNETIGGLNTKIDENNAATSSLTETVRLAVSEGLITAEEAYQKYGVALEDVTTKTGALGEAQAKQLSDQEAAQVRQAEIVAAQSESEKALTQTMVEQANERNMTLKDYQAEQKEITEGIKKSWEEVADSVTNSFERISTKADDTLTFEQLTGNLQHNAQVVEEWSKNLDRLAKLGLDEGLIDQLRKAGPESNAQVKVIADEISKGSDAVATSFETLSSESQEKITKFNTAMHDSLKTGAEALGTVYEETDISPNVNAFVESIKGGLDSSIESQNFNESGKVIVDKTTEGIKENEKTATDGATELTTKVKEAEVKGIEDSKGEIADATKDVIENASDSAESTAQNGGKDVGQKFCDGVVSGINSGRSKIESAAKDAASKAYTSAKNALDIHSPSKKGVELGKNFGSSIGLGMEKVENMTSKTASDFVASMHNSAADYQHTVGKNASSAAQNNINNSNKSIVYDINIENNNNVSNNMDADAVGRRIYNETISRIRDKGLK